MKEVEIKDISGKIRFSTPINKGAKGKFTLMKEDYIILPFSVAKPIAFKMGDYVDLSEVLDESLGGKLSKIYEIVDLQKPTYNSSTGGYDYELKLDAYYWKWKNKIFKYTPENAGSEASWTLTAGLDVQLGVFLRNLKALGYTYKGKEYVFEIDSTVENKAVAMTYDNINLLDALFSMAGEDKWNCDCWVEENVIHFGRNEFGDAVKIERDIEASSITRSESQGTYATRIYAFGGTRNIPSNYGKKFIDTVSFIQGDFRFTGLLYNTNYYLQQDADAQIRFLSGAEKDNIFSVRWNSGHFYFQDDEVCNASVGDRFELLNYPENVPDRYLSYGTEDLVVNGVVQKRLMMPADTPYIDVYPDMSQEEAIESIVVFDDIYPKRVGTMSDVNTVPRDIKEDDKVVGTFDAYQYKDAGLVFDKKYLIEGTELKITFQSGKMNGMEFGVIFDPNDKDEQLWEIVRSEDYGRPLPDEYIHPENGDQYVLSGFNIKLVSDQYIPSAEQELKERAQKYADKTKIDDGTYPVTLRSDWVKEDLILRTFGFGQRINLVDDTFFENGRISRVLGWEMNLDIPWDSPVYTIGESMPYSRIEEIEEKVDSIIYNGQTYNGNYGGGGSYVYVIKTNDSTSPTDSNVFSALRSLATFLRKDKADSTNHLLTLLAGAVFGTNKAEITAEGVAKFLSMVISGGKASIDTEGLLTAVNAIIKGDVKSDNFLAGALGTGYAILKKDTDGKSYLEVDKLFARVKAIFAVLEIMKVTYTGGNFVFSPAGMQCTKVEEYESFYRCFFTADDGEKAVENTFEVDDFVQLREFNVKPGIYENVSNRYFWRRCIAKGDDYIDLSKTDRDMTSNDAPMVGDSLVTIGNKTIKSRQNVIIISVYGEGSPSIIQYAGVNDYSLDGKAVTVISPSGNKFTGSFVIEATGKSVEDELSTAVEVADTAKKAADQAQKDADAANTELKTIASDSYITPSEKTALKQQQADIQAERNEIIANATRYGVSTTAYSTAYTAANNALTKYTASSPQNIEVGADYANISAYYAARKTILDAIAAAAKKLVTDLDGDLQGYKKTVTQKFEAVDGRFTSTINETKEYTDNAVGNIQVGNRNLLLNSGENIIPNNTSYFVHRYESAEQFKLGEKYTVVIKGSTSAGQAFGLWINGATAYAGEFPKNMKGEVAYKYIWIPSNAGTPSVSTLHIYNKPDPNGVSKPCEIEWIAMYEGHIKPPMDWSPAPEDLTTKIEENSSKIEQLPGQISLTVDKKIGDIHVGGRNIARDTSSEWCKEVALTNSVNQGLSGFCGRVYLDTLKVGDEIVVSFDYKWRDFVYGSGWYINLQGSGNVTEWNSGKFTTIYIKDLVSGTSGTIHVTLVQKITADHLKNQYWSLNIRHDYIRGYASVRNFKIEKGNKATTWSPAPEDIDGDLMTLSTEIKQTAESISLKVNQAIGGENLIDNSSFQNNLSGWNINDSTNTIASIVNTTALGGPCLLLSTKKTYAGIFRALSDQGQCYIKEGAVFTTSFDLYKESSSPSRLKVGMEDKGLTDENILDISGHPISAWKRVLITQTMKSTSASFIIYAMSDQVSNVYIKNLKVERGNVATPWIESENERLLSTGIDILNRKMIFTADNTLIQDNSGNKIAMFTTVGGKPLLKAENIDVDNLRVKHLNGADGTFSGSLSAATGTFKGTLGAGCVTSNDAKIGGFTIRDNVMRSDILNAGISFSNGELSNLFLNRMYKQSIWVDDGINNYHPTEKEFTIRTNRTCDMTIPGAGTNLFIADVMNLKYKTMIKSGRYGLQYAMMGSGHIVQDGVVDGGCWYSPGFTANNQVHIITPFDQGNRICVTTEYTGDILVFPTLDKLLQMLGIGVVTRVGTQFSFALTIINASSKTVYVMGKANFTVGDVSFNFDQFPTFYNTTGTLINSENGYALPAHRARQFILTYDGSNYKTFEL